MTRTIFDEIVAGTIPSWKVWEDDNYLAFLTPFANTPGVTVVVPKVNPGAYVFDLDDEQIAGLMRAAKNVAKRLQYGLGVARVAAVFEGEAVPHVHVKLYPMHDMDAPRTPTEHVFFAHYPGYITTQEGPKLRDEDLNKIQKQIIEAAAE